MGERRCAATIVGRETQRVPLPLSCAQSTPDLPNGCLVSANASPGQGGTSLAVGPWTLRGVIPALGRTPALRGYPGGIVAAGPGWSGLAVQDGNHAGDLPQSGSGEAGGPGTGNGPGAGATGRESGTGGVMGAAGGSSVWQQALSAWNEAGLEWQRPAGWHPADSDLQRTEPIPVVRADILLDDAAPAAAPARAAGGGRPPGPGGGQEHGDDRAGRAEGADRARPAERPTAPRRPTGPRRPSRGRRSRADRPCRGG